MAGYVVLPSSDVASSTADLVHRNDENDKCKKISPINDNGFIHIGAEVNEPTLNTYFLSSLPPKSPPPRGTPKRLPCRETPAIPRVANDEVVDATAEIQQRRKRIRVDSFIIVIITVMWLRTPKTTQDFVTEIGMVFLPKKAGFWPNTWKCDWRLSFDRNRLAIIRSFLRTES